MAANVCGEQVRLALLEALTARQLVAVKRKGILYIREVSAMANLTPLIWTYAGGYAFASMPDDWIAYGRSRLRTELTRISRFLSATVAPHATLTPEEEWIKLVLSRLNVVQTALNLLNKAGV
ncbi:hypothetical protein AB0J35_43565 [Nonomuraea angiospora]|uniref:hypothetical protein n=1 Tax=Nonomuraea angiospora TaxID=46172 RepID=UPI0034337117